MNIVALIVVIVVLIFVAFRASKSHFICPECGAHFKLSILQYIFAIHIFSRRMAKCPNCGHTELMTPKWDEK
jgi:predicted RNA-binding Zn-ribbon protein involved in translation (DUF1610 family)